MLRDLIQLLDLRIVRINDRQSWSGRRVTIASPGRAVNFIQQFRGQLILQPTENWISFLDDDEPKKIPFFLLAFQNEWILIACKIDEMVITSNMEKKSFISYEYVLIWLW